MREFDLENRDWETLASWLSVSTIPIKENCGTSTGMAQCYRRELVKAICEMSGEDPERVKEDIRHVLESKMRIKKQG